MKRRITATNDANTSMVISVFEGVNADGFTVNVIDASGKSIFSQRYDYGRNASYSKSGADNYKPYASDIISELCDTYSISPSDISVVAGKNAFRRADVDESVVKDFIDSYL